MSVESFTAAGSATDSGTVHVIATSLEGTREALDAATALARGLSGYVVLFIRRAAPALGPDGKVQRTGESERALRALAESYTPRPKVLSCVCERAVDIVQLFQSPGRVVIGGSARWWWPTAEQRLAKALTQLGCHVTYVHVPRGMFVPPLLAARREHAPDAAIARDSSQAG